MLNQPSMIKVNTILFIGLFVFCLGSLQTWLWGTLALTVYPISCWPAFREVSISPPIIKFLCSLSVYLPVVSRICITVTFALSTWVFPAFSNCFYFDIKFIQGHHFLPIHGLTYFDLISNVIVFSFLFELQAI